MIAAGIFLLSYIGLQVIYHRYIKKYTGKK